MVTHQLQVERRTAKGHRPKTDALPLDYWTTAVYAVTLDPLLSLYEIIYVTWYTRLLPKATRVKIPVAFGTRSRDYQTPTRHALLGCQGQLQAIYSEFPKFHPNPFTSGEVIAEHVNIVETRHKVFPILGEASASLPSNKSTEHY